MPVTINVYSELAVTYLARYGVLRDDRPIYVHPLYGILCSTDIAEFDSSFTGRVDELLSSGVVELPTANGYSKYGQELRQYYTGIQLRKIYPNGLGQAFFVSAIQQQYVVTSYNITSSGGYRGRFTPSTRQFPLLTPSDINYQAYVNPIQSFTWQATGSGLNAKSLLLFYQTPFSPGNLNALYSNSYPLAMVDFGGTITAAAGQFLNLPYPPVADIFRWRVE